MAPTVYAIDGGLSGSGVLDVAREVQLRIKHWGYAYKLSNDTKWVDRAWQELQVRDFFLFFPRFPQEVLGRLTTLDGFPSIR